MTGVRHAGPARFHCSQLARSGRDLLTGSSYRSGRTRTWQKGKCFITREFIVVRQGPRSWHPEELILARESGGRLDYAGRAVLVLGRAEREDARAMLDGLESEQPCLKSRSAAVEQLGSSDSRGRGQAA